MVNRPDYSPDVPLTAKELAEVRVRYAQLSRPWLRDALREHAPTIVSRAFMFQEGSFAQHDHERQRILSSLRIPESVISG
jgi:hypothetical protein